MSALTTFIVDRLRNKEENRVLNLGGPMRVKTPAEIAEERLNRILGVPGKKSTTPTDRALAEIGE